MTDVKKALRHALREIKERQAELGNEEAAIKRALEALDGDTPSTKRRRKTGPMVSYEERVTQVLRAMAVEPDRPFTYADMRALGVPSGSQTELRNRLLDTGRVVKVGETDSGGPILQLRQNGALAGVA